MLRAWLKVEKPESDANEREKLIISNLPQLPRDFAYGIKH